MDEDHTNSDGFTPLFSRRSMDSASIGRSLESAQLSLEPTPPAMRDDFVREKMDDRHRTTSACRHSPLRETNAIAPPRSALFKDREEMAAIQNSILANQEASRTPTQTNTNAFTTALLDSAQCNQSEEKMAAAIEFTNSTAKTAQDAVAKAALEAMRAGESDECSSDEEGSSEEEDFSQAQTAPLTEGYTQQTPAQHAPLSFHHNQVHSVGNSAMKRLDMSPFNFNVMSSMFAESDFSLSGSPQMPFSPCNVQHHDAMQQVMQNPIFTPQAKESVPVSSETKASNSSGGEERACQVATINNVDEKESIFCNIKPSEDIKIDEGTVLQNAATEDLDNPDSPCETTKGGIAMIRKARHSNGENNNRVVLESDSPEIQAPKYAPQKDSSMEDDLDEANSEPPKVEVPVKPRPTETPHAESQKASSDEPPQEADPPSPKEAQPRCYQLAATLAVPRDGGKQARVNRRKPKRSKDKPLDKENDLTGRNTKRRELPTRGKKSRVANACAPSPRLRSDSAKKFRAARVKSPFGGTTNTWIINDDVSFGNSNGSRHSSRFSVCSAKSNVKSTARKNATQGKGSTSDKDGMTAEASGCTQPDSSIEEANKDQLQKVVPLTEARPRFASPTDSEFAKHKAIEAANMLLKKSPEIGVPTPASAGKSRRATDVVAADATPTKPFEESAVVEQKISPCEAATMLLQGSPEFRCATSSTANNLAPKDVLASSALPQPGTKAAVEDSFDSYEESDVSDRAVNPLLGYRIGNDPCQLDPEKNEPPHVSEILRLSEICYPKPDTYPISYVARLLGCEVPNLSSRSGKICHNPQDATFSIPRDEAVYKIPEEGRAVSMWKEQLMLSPNRICKKQFYSFMEDVEFETFRKDTWDAFVQYGWKTQCLVPFRPENVDINRKRLEKFLPENVLEKMHRCIIEAKDCDLLSISNWEVDVEFHESKSDPKFSLHASNMVEGHSTYYALNFCFAFYADVEDDETYDSVALFEKSPIVVSLPEVSALEKDLLFEEEGGGPNNPILLLLFGLIVDVGRFLGAKNCFLDLEVNSAIVEVLSTHFRMSQAGRVGFGEKRGKFVCDLSQSSLKSAVRHRLSHNEGAISERLLVALPTVEEVKRALERRKSDRLLPNLKASREDWRGQTLTSAPSKTCGAFTVRLRLKNDSTSNSRSMDLHVINTNGQEEPALKSTRLSKVTPWLPFNVIKMFPRRKINEQDHFSRNNNEVLEELKKKQQELAALENVLVKTKIQYLMDEVVKERADYNGRESVLHRSRTQQVLDEYERRFSSRDLGRTWQQLEDDMEAICVICNEGEVTPHNWIVICDGCESPLHQDCYGITEVPKGKFFCRPCQLKRDKVIADDPVCELCPISDGAFLPIESQQSSPKWVHVVCAKWQNLGKINPTTYEDPKDIVENFLVHDISCCLCLGARGAFVHCYDKTCKTFMHITCARYSGVCDVKNSDARAEIAQNTIFCPMHSTRDELDEDEGMMDGPIPIPELVQLAKRIPPAPTPFTKQTRDQQRQALMDPGYEREFLQKLAHSLPGARCDVCSGAYGETMVQCQGCRARICAICTEHSETNWFQRGAFLCGGCLHKANEARTPQGNCSPQCNLCYQKSGWLRKASASLTVRRSKWFQRFPHAFTESLFRKQLWCHTICSRVHIAASEQDTQAGLVDLSKCILADGHSLLKPKSVCSLCGNTGGLKKACKNKKCRSGIRRGAHVFHATCAWQAGFSVSPARIGNKAFNLCCLAHSDTENNLRAKIEDLLDVEATRNKKRRSSGDVRMTYQDAATVLNASIDIIRVLGWAWRWEEWWVKTNYNWEPFLPHLKEGQTEDDFTDEEKRVVVSTPAGRQADAARCSLASFGAALRNRDYDTAEGFKSKALHRALRTILQTKSLVGPLKTSEIDFLEEWLARAYRSKSRHLCLGEDKVPIGEAKFCYITDVYPKFELGNRPLPGTSCLDIGERTNVGGISVSSSLGAGSLTLNAAELAQKDSSGNQKSLSTEGATTFSVNRAGSQTAEETKEGEEAQVTAESSDLACPGGTAASPYNTDGKKKGELVTLRQAGLVLPEKDLQKDNGFIMQNSAVNAKTGPPTEAIASAAATLSAKVRPCTSPAQRNDAQKCKMGDGDSGTVTKHSISSGDNFVKASAGLETQSKRSKTVKSAALVEARGNKSLSSVGAQVNNSGERENVKETPNYAATMKGQQNTMRETTELPTFKKRSRGDATVLEDTVGKAEEPFVKAVKRGGPAVGIGSSMKTNQIASMINRGKQVAIEDAHVIQKDRKETASKKRLFREMNKDLGKKIEELAENANDEEDKPGVGDEDSSSEIEDGHDDDESEETIKTVLTVRTRKELLEDATYKEACKKLQLKSPALKIGPFHRLSNATTTTARLTSSPGGRSVRSIGTKTCKSGMSRRLRPTQPTRGVSFGKPTTKPSKVGIKGSSVNEDEMEDHRRGLVDDATFSGRSLHMRQDDISVLTESTHFPQQDYDEMPASRASYGSDVDSINAAIKKAGSDRFDVYRNTEFPNHLTHDKSCRHQPVYLGNTLRGECVLCSRDDVGVKTRFGCHECFILAFEHRYKVRIDRNNIPAYFKHRAVFLCAEGEEGDGSCFERWHAKDESSSAIKGDDSVEG